MVTPSGVMSPKRSADQALGYALGWRFCGIFAAISLRVFRTLESATMRKWAAMSPTKALQSHAADANVADRAHTRRFARRSLLSVFRSDAWLVNLKERI